MEKYDHFIAIDFGTAGCGFACATKADTEPKVYNLWPGSKHKTPTVLLVRPDEYFEAFGQEALQKYYKDPHRFKDYYFFRNFKMQLYENKGVLSDLEIKTENNGKKLPAVTVFSLAISYLKRKAIEWIDTWSLFHSRKILWIITVPAIWSYHAKQVMRQAADKATYISMKDDETILVLEPEAAAINCIQDNIIQVQPRQSVSYILVDCGGGTVDIVAHEISVSENKEISIVELCPPHGNSLGGYKINHEFESLLSELCDISLEEIKSKYPREWDSIVYNIFEQGKIQAQPPKCLEAKIEFKSNLCKYLKNKTGKTMKDLVKEYQVHKLLWNDNDNNDDDDESGKLVLPYSTMYRLLHEVVYGISVVIETVLSKCSKIDTIVFVGGFSSSDLFCQEIEALFPKKTILTSNDPRLSVLKGAVQYGMDGKIIKSRKIPHSIGFETYIPFEKRKHADNSKVTIDGKDYCKVFLQCTEANKTVGQSDKIKQVFKSLKSESTTCVFTLYGSQSVMRKGYPVAKFSVENLDRLPQDGKFEVSLSFGGAEVQVSACSATNSDIHLPVKVVKLDNAEGVEPTFKLDVKL